MLVVEVALAMGQVVAIVMALWSRHLIMVIQTMFTFHVR